MATNFALNPDADQLDADQQATVRDAMLDQKLRSRRRRVLEIPQNRFPKAPAPNPTGAVAGGIGGATNPEGAKAPEGTATANAEAGSAATKRSADAVKRKFYSKEQIRTRLKGQALAALGGHRTGTMMGVLLALAVMKDSMDLLSLSLFSWIDWIFDLGMWVMFILAFGQAPKTIRAELRAISTVAALVEFVPFLDLLTTWTFMVIYAWVRTSGTVDAAYRHYTGKFQAEDVAKGAGAASSGAKAETGAAGSVKKAA